MCNIVSCTVLTLEYSETLIHLHEQCNVNHTDVKNDCTQEKINKNLMIEIIVGDCWYMHETTSLCRLFFN